MRFTVLLGLVGLTWAWNTTCQNPRVRKSWHNLTNPERSEYIRAVKCMWTIPPKGNAYFSDSKNRHDDFVSLHINHTTPPDPTNNPANRGVIGPGIHFNGVFLSWHRYLVWNFENVLINECNYTGAQPFWDWTLDTPEYGSSFEKSPVFDPVYGFGGNGAGGTVSDPLDPTQNQLLAPKGTCIGDGPFKDLNGTMGYGFNLYNPEPHCIIRNFNISLANASLQWSKNIKHLLSFSNYWNMSQEWDFSTVGAPVGPHGGGHGGVDGEMRNVWSSINDPLFFMHHTQIDHIWWIWQNLYPENKFQVGGPVYPNGTGGWVTPDYPIEMTPFIAPDVKIHNILDTLNNDGSGVLCYTYDDFRYPWMR